MAGFGVLLSGSIHACVLRSTASEDLLQTSWENTEEVYRIKSEAFRVV